MNLFVALITTVVVGVMHCEPIRTFTSAVD
jgi:hypothetical protein